MVFNIFVGNLIIDIGVVIVILLILKIFKIPMIIALGEKSTCVRNEELKDEKNIFNKFLSKIGLSKKTGHEWKIQIIDKEIRNGLQEIRIVAGEISEGTRKTIDHCLKEGYLFSWEDVPGNDSGILIEFLTQKFSIDWLKTAKIEKIGDGKTIRITTEKKSLSLRLNSEKTKVNLEIDDGRTDEFTVKIEKGKLNIYKEGIRVFVVSGRELGCPTEDLKKFITNPKFKLRTLEKRPKSHKTIIGRNILLEEFHAPGEPYKKALGIEKPFTNILDYHNEDFESLFSEAQEIKSPKDLQEKTVCLL
jgi:hypothetical protein